MPLDAAATQCVATPPAGDTAQSRCGSHPTTRIRWGVVHTHPQAERWACSNLLRQGFNAWLPLRKAIRRDPATRTMTRLVDVPLFTSYVFVVVPRTGWAPIRHTLGVNRLMMAGENPYILPDGAVRHLTDVMWAGRTNEPSETLKRPGDAVAPRTGVFQGLPGVVLTTDEAAGTSTVGFLFLGRLQEVTYPNEELSARQDY